MHLSLDLPEDALALRSSVRKDTPLKFDKEFGFVISIAAQSFISVA